VSFPAALWRSSFRRWRMTTCRIGNTYVETPVGSHDFFLPVSAAFLLCGDAVTYGYVLRCETSWWSIGTSPPLLICCIVWWSASRLLPLEASQDPSVCVYASLRAIFCSRFLTVCCRS
jgi:hypothetical protein